MSITFKKPGSIAEALDILSEYQDSAVIVNGGTDIVQELAEGKIYPKMIVFVADIPEMKQLYRENDEIVLGGAVTYEQMEDDPITNGITGLMTCLHRLGSPTIRGVATPAGNLGKGAPAADCSTMLVALGATVVLESIHGRRSIPAEELFTGVFKTVIGSDELITQIRFPAIRKSQGTGYCKVSRRKMQDIGKILAGAVIKVEDGICTDCAVSLGALNATIVRSRDVESRILGKTREQAHEAIMAALPEEAGFRESYFKHYKELVTAAAIDEAVMQAWTDAEGAQI